MPVIVKEGYDFCFDPDACGSCQGYCCSGESGNVWLSDIDAKKISTSLGMNVIDFLEQYVNRSSNRLSLKENYVEGTFQCILYNEKIQGCSVYDVRPEQCRLFPFWEYFRENRAAVLKECPGIRECHSGE